MINIALPKGRLGEVVYLLLEKAGYGCGEYPADGRKLIINCGENGVNYFWVKPSDSAVYVELGAADAGIAGKDVLGETQPDVYEIMDLNVGKCKLCVAAKNGFKDDLSRPLRVATKYVNSAENYFASIGREIEIIKLNGSIELAPVLGLSDVIVDVVETGATLKENDLCVLEEVTDVSARFIVNKSAYKFKSKEINLLAQSLKGILKNGNIKI